MYVDPMEHRSLGGSKYFVTLLDSFSGFPIARFIERKNKTTAAVAEMITEAENLLRSATKRLISSNRSGVK